MAFKIWKPARGCFIASKKEAFSRSFFVGNPQYRRGKQGFSLLELLIGIAILGVVYVAVFVTMEGLLERWYLRMAVDQVVQTLKQAQLLALTQRRAFGIQGTGTQLWITGSDNQPLGEESWESLPADLTLTANRWPSFSPYGFARGGTIKVESERFFLQVKVGPIGGIRYTEIQNKP